MLTKRRARKIVVQARAQLIEHGWVQGKMFRPTIYSKYYWFNRARTTSACLSAALQAQLPYKFYDNDPEGRWKKAYDMARTAVKDSLPREAHDHIAYWNDCYDRTFPENLAVLDLAIAKLT